MDTTWARIFEVLSVATPIVIWLVIRTRLGGNPHLYAGLLACGTCFLWEWYMDVGPLQLFYSHEFVDLWTINGVALPAFMPFAYAWYWFLPNLFLLPNVKWLDEHWGRWQYLWIWLLGGVWNVIVEWPFTTLTDLWTYHWKESWTIGGMPVLNPPIAGLTTLLVYVFGRYLWTRDAGQGVRQLYLPHVAAMSLAFYLTWLPFTYILGETQSHWHV